MFEIPKDQELTISYTDQDGDTVLIKRSDQVGIAIDDMNKVRADSSTCTPRSAAVAPNSAPLPPQDVKFEVGEDEERAQLKRLRQGEQISQLWNNLYGMAGVAR